METITAEEIRRAIQSALAEDVGAGDATTLATVPETLTAKAVMRAREPMRVAGLDLAEAAFTELSAAVQVERIVSDGDSVDAGAPLLVLYGKAQALLTAERVALNFVQRLSGIATLTAAFVRQVAGTGAQILDTRKTTPGLRRFEKYAVTAGGGKNHRLGLFDMILIKDNHLAALRTLGSSGAITAAIQSARLQYPHLDVEIETETLEEVREAVVAGADVILLDNMSIQDIGQAVRIVAGRAKTEASGGVDLARVRAIAETGVDLISVGALTHSARAMDIGLDFEIA